MSKLYDPSSDHRNWWTLGSTVRFNGPNGERLEGEIVRMYAGGGSFHVEVDGRRYEVDAATDSMEMVW